MSAKILLALALQAFLIGDAHAASRAASPVFEIVPAQNGAVIVRLTSPTPEAIIHYTVDGTAPTQTSQIYKAPFLVASQETVNAFASAKTLVDSAVVTKKFTPKIESGALIWSDEFTNSQEAKGQPNPIIWTYDTGNSGFGNHELETYCAWRSNEAPCSQDNPSAFVGSDGFLHIEARQTSPQTYSSARLKTQGLFSFQYGRFEIRAKVPEAQGFWPAGWLLGNNVETVDWPACGEQDVLERVNAAKNPDWNEGSIHGIGFTGDVGLGMIYNFPANQTAAGWHTYGMIWKKGSVAYYVDDPAHPYVTYTTGDLSKFKKAIWPFDAGQSNFILLNLAIGGDWPHSPDATASFPAEMLVDYVRIYAN